MDSNNKGFIEIHDFKKLILDNCADPKVFKMEKIMRYFASGKKISKVQFLKALAIPPWKIDTELLSKIPNKKRDKPYRLLFKLIVAIYLAVEEDDTERIKMKDANL